MTKTEEKLERVTCRKLVKLYKRKYTVSGAAALHEKAYSHYRAMVSCGDGSVSSGAILFDHVAYVNALARYCTAHGIMIKEIR